jgi:D-amino-acid dehydrogenase
MAQWAAEGKLKKGDPFVHESIIGSLFRGTVEDTTLVGQYEAIIPSIEGWAVVTGYNTIFIDDDDPYKHGFQVLWMNDVLVLGGGAVGACTAYELSRAGAQVTLVERGEIGHQCSLHNAGLVVPSHIVPLAAPGVLKQGLKWMLDPDSPFYVQPRLDPGLLSWVWHFRRAATPARMYRSIPVLRDLLRAARALFDDYAALPGFNINLTPNGLVMLFRTGRGERALVEEADLAHRMGVEARVLDSTGLEALHAGVPFLASGGVYFPHDAHLDPGRFVVELRSLLEREGVRILASRTITGAIHNGRAVTGVRCDGETLQADAYVVAGGAWSPQIVSSLGLRLPMQPGKGYSVTVPDQGLRLSIPLILSEARVAVTPLNGAARYAGTMELAGFDLSMNRRRIHAMLMAVPLYLDTTPPHPGPPAELWAGLRPCSPDGLPYIGRFRRFPNLVAATGHAMLGITLAPVTGRVVAELLSDRQVSVDITMLAPDRFTW